MNDRQLFDVEQVLVARAALYGLLQRVFSEAPDEELSKNETCEVMTQCFDVLGEACGLRDRRECTVGDWRADDSADKPEGAPLSLGGEYHRLFVGVGKPAVCLWESIYLTGINALFQQNTLEVRRFYARHGFEARDAGRVADDHLAIELAFLRELALQTASSEGSERIDLLRAQQEFLTEHVARWVNSFVDQVVEHDRTGYYRGYARLLSDFIAQDAVLLDSLLA